jgi:putative ABC transport system permease protein
MKFLGYIGRNARRNPIRSLLTIASIAVSGFLIMILISFVSLNTEIAESLRVYNRVIAMSSQGFAQPVPYRRVGEIAQMDGVVATTPFSWFGGKFREDPLPFAQFAVDANNIFNIYDEFKVPASQLEAFKKDKEGCVIGIKLAEDKKLKVGDPVQLKGDAYPVNLTLTVRGIYDATPKNDRRMCFFHFEHLDEAMKKERKGYESNAGVVVIKCKNSDVMAPLSKKIDEAYRNSDTPTRTQTEEAFNKMFAEMFGDMSLYIGMVGVAVGVALFCVSGVAMAMSMRERTTELAVLKAIGFSKPLLLFLVLAESIVIAGVGGVVGSLGAKAFFDAIDVSPYTGGFLPFFFVPWTTAMWGVGASLFIGFASGLVPAIRAAQLSVIDGLRKVV